MLIAHGIIKLADLLPYLSPNIAETLAWCKSKVDGYVSDVKTYGVVSLTSRASDTTATPTATAASATTAASTASKDSASASTPKSTAGSGTTAAASVAAKGASGAAATTPKASAETSSGAPAAKKEDGFAGGNQIFGLLAAAYQLHQVKLAQEIEDILVSAGCGIPASFCNEVREALISLVLWRTDVVYQPLSFRRLGLAKPASNIGSADKIVSDILLSMPQRCTQVAELSTVFSELLPLLRSLSHHVGTSPELFTRLCRLIIAIMWNGQSTSMEVENDDKAVSVPADIMEVFTTNMFPGLTRFEKTACPMASQLWLAISKLPYEIRFTLYDAWRGHGLGKDGLASPKGGMAAAGKDPILCLAEVKVLHFAKSQLKRLSKENVKQMARSLSTCTHNCPLISYTHILNSIEVFDNMIPFVVDALKYTTDLSRDVMAYALYVQLQKDSQKLKPGDTHYTQWFSSLTKFIAVFYKKYPTTCLSGLLRLVVKSLSNSESLDLLVLRELLTKMGGCETMLDLSHIQLEGLSGGKTLQNETMGGQVKELAVKKSIRILRDEFTKTNTALPLLYLTSSIRSNIIFNMETNKLKLVSHMYDVCQDVLMQFTDFLVQGTLSTINSAADKIKAMEAIAGEKNII